MHQRRSLIFALATSLVVLSFLLDGIRYSAFTDPYGRLTDEVINLTEMQHSWRQTFLRQGQVIAETAGPLPQKKFGSNVLRADEIHYETTISLPKELSQATDVAIHFSHIFARSFSVLVDHRLIASSSDHRHDSNIVIPRSQQQDSSITITVQLDTTGVAEPGFDIRANLLIGPKPLLDRVTARIDRRDQSLVLWLLIPALVVATLFSLGSIIFVYSREYQFFSLFCLFSGLRTAAMYGRLPLLPNVVDPALLGKTLHLMAIACLILFIMSFFRRNDPWLKVVAYAITCFAVGQVLLAQAIASPSQVFYLTHQFTWAAHFVALGYGFWAAKTTFLFLKKTQKSKPRLMMSAVITAVFLTAIPFSLGWMAFADAFWLAGPLFDLAFMMVLAGCVSVDIGGVRADRDLIRQKLGMFTDEAKVSLILHNQARDPFVVREITAMMIDLRSFCVISEVYDKREIFDAMSDYYNTVIDHVYRSGGIVDKFMGDGILATWGMSGDTTSGNALSCVRAAIAIRSAMRELNERRLAQGAFPLSIGMGIHSGKVSVGVLGTPNRAEFTVVGSAINIAARIEKSTKMYASDILISEATWQQIKNDVVVCHRGDVHISESLATHDAYHLIGIVENGLTTTHEPLYDEITSSIAHGCSIPFAAKNLIIPEYTHPQSLQKNVS